MSDMPMRLKYLTKMKIILCIFLLYITAVSVFGEPQELNGIVGESVNFTAAVKKVGNLIYSGVPIGDVTGGSFTVLRNEKFSGRLQWDSSTGLFSLSGLRLEDSGVYTVQNPHQNINTVFQLNVYILVLKPHVSITRNEYPCTIECTAESGTGVTLSWYREGEKEPYVSSRVASAPHLHLPQTVESGTYTCEAKNSVSNEKASITVEAHCAAGFSTGTIVLIVLLVVLICLSVGLIFLLCSCSSTGIVVLVPFLVFALIAILICLLCFSPAGSSTGIVVLVPFLIFALIAVLICFWIKRKILDNRIKHLIIDGSKTERRGKTMLSEPQYDTVGDEVQPESQYDTVDQNKPPIVYDVVTIKSQGDEVQPESQYDEGEQAIKDGTDMSDRSDEPKNGTPQTGSYTINPQP